MPSAPEDTASKPLGRPLDGQVVLITGGTGSLGQALVRRILTGEFGEPERIIVLSRDEAKQWAMKTSWKHATAATEDIYFHNFDELIEFQIGDVRDYGDVQEAVAKSDIVFHAAAMKQVPTCEYFPSQAVATNVQGAENVVRAVRRSERVHTVVGISTDKACKPVNVMGMSKAIQERVLIEGNLRQERCRLVVVRYGNVLSSRGSVVPLFEQQIAAGGPVTVTHPDMTRFLLSLDEAVNTIFAAVAWGDRGDMVVPRVRAARVADLAEAMVNGRPIAIEQTGIRPGEKMHEILVSEEEALRTGEMEGYYVVRPMLPELAADIAEPAIVGDYSSADAVVTGADLLELLGQSDFIDPAMGAGASA